MKKIRKIQTTVKEIIENPTKFTDIFLSDGIVVFEKLFASESDQGKIMLAMGEVLDWEPFSHTCRYEENHSQRAKMLNGQQCASNETLIEWHIEHISRQKMTIAALWNMQIFDCGPENGTTLFADCSKAVESLSKEEIDFATRCETISLNGYTGEEFGVTRRMIINHRNSNVKIIRCNSLMEEKLVYFDGNKPNDEHISEYVSILKKIRSWTCEQDENKQILNWSCGDMAVPDLIKMAHSVNGGFRPEQRKFVGYWVYENK